MYDFGFYLNCALTKNSIFQSTLRQIALPAKTSVIFIVWKTKFSLDFDSLKSNSPNNPNLKDKNTYNFGLYIKCALRKIQYSSQII